MSIGAEWDEMVWPRRSLCKGGGTDMSINHQSPTMKQSETIELEWKHFLNCILLGLQREESYQKQKRICHCLGWNRTRIACDPNCFHANEARTVPRPDGKGLLQQMIHGCNQTSAVYVPKTWPPLCWEKAEPCSLASRIKIKIIKAVFLRMSKRDTGTQEISRQCGFSMFLPSEVLFKEDRVNVQLEIEQEQLLRRCYLRPLPKQYSVSTVSIKLKIGWFLKTSVSNAESKVKVSWFPSSPKRNHWIEQHAM